MSGNEKSGRKRDKLPSFEIRFRMPGRFKKKLEKRASKFGTNYNHYVKHLVEKDLAEDEA